jgi:hypothetical protein
MNDGTHDTPDTRPEWFADFERKLVELIRTSPGSRTQDLGACLTVLIPRGGSADNAVFGGLVTSREEPTDLMRMELLTAVIWALLADGVSPEALRATFEHSLGITEVSAELIPAELDWADDGPVN